MIRWLNATSEDLRYGDANREMYTLLDPSGDWTMQRLRTLPIFMSMLIEAAGCDSGAASVRATNTQVHSATSFTQFPLGSEVTLFDDFEDVAVADFWRPGNAGSGRYESGAVVTSTDYSRHGTNSVRITVNEGDIQQTGDDGQLTERAELDSGKHEFVGREVWYGFSMLIPPDFPIVDNRLVVAQWKQNGVGGSPLIAQRYHNGVHELTIRRPDATSWKRFSLPKLKPGQWHDMIYQIRFSIDASGLINAG